MAESRYVCYYEECKKLFKSKYNLVRHVNTKHLQIKNFACVECSKTFGSTQNLEVHSRVHTEGSLTVLDNGVSHKLAFRLSDHYREVSVVHKVERSLLPLPSLPKIDRERQNNQLNRKLPVNLELLKD